MELDEVMASLGKKTRERVKIANEIEVHKQPTASAGLTQALRGGIGYGRQTNVWGNKSASKTSFCLATIGRAQREQDKIAAFIDAEGTFDPAWAERMGVDTGSLIVSEAKTIADMANVAVEFMVSGVEIMVVDSISALLSSAYFEKDKDDLKELDKTKQIGSEAKDMANAVKMMNYVNRKCALILISQVRNQINTYGAAQKPTGGFAVDFFASTVIKLWSSPNDKEQIKEKIQIGNSVMEAPVGRTVSWTVEKNKMGPPNQVGEYDFYYDGPFVGVDAASEAVRMGVRFGIVKKGGAWYTVYGNQTQGEEATAKYVRENPLVLEKLQAEIGAAA